MLHNLFFDELVKGEEKDVSELVENVFREFVAPDFSAEGLNTFMTFIAPDSIIQRNNDDQKHLKAKV